MEWIDEETFFDRRRRDPKLEILEKKWSGGSSPTILIRAGYPEKQPAYKDCYWYDYPSSNRCFECEHAKVCDKYVS